MKRLALPLALCSALLATSAAEGSDIKQCGRVSVSGEKVPVSARKLECDRARRIARYFLRTGDAPSGWKLGNLAGCEWQFAPRGQSLYRWRVHVVRFRGCDS